MHPWLEDGDPEFLSPHDVTLSVDYETVVDGDVGGDFRAAVMFHLDEPHIAGFWWGAEDDTDGTCADWTNGKAGQGLVRSLDATGEVSLIPCSQPQHLLCACLPG